MKAGFAEIDITPPPGTKKGGWMEDLEARDFLDPLHARVALFREGDGGIAFIQLDILSIRWSDINDLRHRIEANYGFPGNHVMISATHNHAGPAIARLAPVIRQNAYVESMKTACVKAFGMALDALQEVEIGFGSAFEFDTAFNRRTVMRDGTVRTQTFFSNPHALCMEGPADPEVAVILARDKSGRPAGAMVNFACHPTHHGGTNEISAGFPGVLADRMKSWGCPVTLFLNGAYGNVITVDFQRCISKSKEEAGERLFEAVKRTYADMHFESTALMGSAMETLELPFRRITDDEYHGRVPGVQRFRSDDLYQAEIDLIREKIARYGTQKAEIQVLRLGDRYFAAIPAEYFVEYQLKIKAACYPQRAYIVGGANGMLGYVPTREAFARGGYETTLGPPSRMAPETGDLLAASAIGLIKSMS